MSVAERWADEFLPQMREAAAAAEPAPAAVELTVVVPTLNERDNVPLLVEQLNRVLAAYLFFEDVNAQSFAHPHGGDGKDAAQADRE